MTEQTNGQDEKHEDAQSLAIRANVKTELARLDHEERLQMAEMARNMPVPLRVMFDPNMNERVRKAAEIMSEARGFTPTHLCGKTEACFAVVTKALTWGMDPWAVAASTFQTPDGKVGYEGKLIQAIIEGSGKLSKPIGQGQYFGDWSKVEGNFKIVKKRSQSGKDYDAPDPGWTYYGPDEEGLGVRYEVHLKGQTEPLKFEMLLKQAFPRNATTWPTRTKMQLHYAAMRALGNVVCPSLIMGVPSRDEMYDDEPPPMREINPPPAPPPVDLTTEGIRGAGRMTVEDEAAQDGGPKTAERIDPETGEVLEAPGVAWRGKNYQRPGAARTAALKEIAQAGSPENLAALKRPVEALCADLERSGSLEFAQEIRARFKEKEDATKGGESDGPAGESPARQQNAQEQSFDHAEMPGDTTPPGPADMIDRGEQQEPDDEDMPNLGF